MPCLISCDLLIRKSSRSYHQVKDAVKSVLNQDARIASLERQQDERSPVSATISNLRFIWSDQQLAQRPDVLQSFQMLDVLYDAFSGTVIESFTRATDKFLLKFSVTHWSFAAAFSVIDLPGKT